MRLKTTICASALALLTVGAADASALVSHGAKGSPGPGDTLIATAECGPGQKVVSGGFQSTPDAYAAYSRAAGKDGWKVKMHEASELTVVANCSKRLDVRRASKRVAFGNVSGVRRTARAKCAKGWTAVSGGWKYGGLSDNSPVFTSKPAGRKWSVSAFGDGSDNITAYAYCLKRDVARASKTSPIIGQEGANGAQAKCKAGDELLGGGFKISPRPDFGNQNGPDPFYFLSTRSGERSWASFAHNYGQPGRVTVYATCLK